MPFLFRRRLYVANAHKISLLSQHWNISTWSSRRCSSIRHFLRRNISLKFGYEWVLFYFLHFHFGLFISITAVETLLYFPRPPHTRGIPLRYEEQWSLGYPYSWLKISYPRWSREISGPCWEDQMPSRLHNSTFRNWFFIQALVLHCLFLVFLDSICFNLGHYYRLLSLHLTLMPISVISVIKRLLHLPTVMNSSFWQYWRRWRRASLLLMHATEHTPYWGFCDSSRWLGECGLPLSKKIPWWGSHHEDRKMRANVDKFLLIQLREGF